MTRRAATLAAVLAVLCGGAVAAASADAGSRERAATADTAKRASTACGTSSRARSTCRRGRRAAAYRRTKRRGRALLTLPSGEHNLWIAPPPASGRPALLVSEAVGEHGGATKTVPVTPGTWRLYCSLTGHDVMARNLAVE